MLKYVHVLLGLESLFKGCHATGATKRSIISYDEKLNLQKKHNVEICSRFVRFGIVIQRVSRDRGYQAFNKFI